MSVRHGKTSRVQDLACVEMTDTEPAKLCVGRCTQANKRQRDQSGTLLM